MKQYLETKQKALQERVIRILNPETIKINTQNTSGKGSKKYSPNNKKLIERYYIHLTKNYLNLTTRVHYLQHLRNLILDINKDIVKVTAKDIDTYLIKISNLAPRTQYERKKFLYIFFAWLKNKDKESLKKTILKDIRLIKPKKELLEGDILTVKDISAMIRHCRTDRERAIISVLYESGCRKGEFLQLRIKDIERKEFGFAIRIPKGKTNSRMNYLVDSFVYLNNWLESHPLRDNLNAPLWVNEGAWLGRATGEDGIKRLVKITSQRAEIHKRVYPHIFRHSRASFFAKHGKNEDFLRRWFGWSKTSRMPSYYVHTFASDTQNEYLQFKGVKKNIKQNKEELAILESKKCPRCKTPEIPNYFKFCPKCCLALDLESAMRYQASQKDASAMGKEMLMQGIDKDILKEIIQEVIKKVKKK